MKKQLTIRCGGCNNERITDAVDPYTGCPYGAGFTFTCTICGSEIDNVRPTPEPGKHELECEKTLAEHIYKQGIHWGRED